MNDIEKAIEYYKAKSYEDGGLRDKFTKLAIEALEKQVPKHATNNGRNLLEGTAYCPSCGAFFLINHKYCFNCGQALEVEK